MARDADPFDAVCEIRFCSCLRAPHFARLLLEDSGCNLAGDARFVLSLLSRFVIVIVYFLLRRTQVQSPSTILLSMNLPLDTFFFLAWYAGRSTRLPVVEILYFMR